MIESADWLCEKHFGRNLIDKDVEILDPATGTGTFVCELLEHFRGLHANEVAILPYYVANLNIEATYAAITGEYEEYPNLCFVDTLDNVAGLRKHAGHIDDMFGGVTDINIKRIREQNNRRISVIIGNPPYNANQLNENENNKNREYPEIDRRIKETYIAVSAAQKTKMYDMYARFFRWATDRLDENGVLALITNRSFIDSRTFDGFRTSAAKEFNEIRIVDLGGDVRANPKLSGTIHNVFGIQTGVAISFMVRRPKQKGCQIFYTRRPEMERAEEKISALANSKLDEFTFEQITPDSKSNWINLADDNFDSLLPIASKEAKATIVGESAKAIAQLYTLGVNSGRDDWMFDFSRTNLVRKLHYLLERYHSDLERLKGTTDPKEIDKQVSQDIKWTAELKVLLRKHQKIEFDNTHIVDAVYRPFVKSWYYYDRPLTKRFFRIHECQPTGNEENVYLLFPAHGSTRRIDFAVFATNKIPDLNFFTPDPAHSIVLYRYDENGRRAENITDWAFEKFKRNYRSAISRQNRQITKRNIFQYVYAVLHDTNYRNKYSLSLKREFPRVPFYKDFWQWADWGKSLMDLHIGYESVAPAKLKRTDVPDEKAKKAGQAPKAMLRADKDGGRIFVDSETTLAGIPPDAWEYKLGNRSGLEWVLDQYKESKSKDPTIREKFDTYRFADYKEKVIDLLARVTTVSVETQRIVEAMRKTPRN